MSKSRPERENRRSVRHPTSVKARICYGPDGAVATPCTIRNISTGGAMIEVPEVSLLPLAFRLEDPARGFKRDCKVVWRRGDQVGVSFTQAIDPQSKATPAARDLLAAWKSLFKR